MLDGCGVSSTYAVDADTFMWHVFGVHGREPQFWFAARDLMRDSMLLADRYYADVPTRLKFVRDAMIYFVTGSL